MASQNPWCERGVSFPPRKILVIHHDMDCACLLARALRRDFPQAEMQVSIQADVAAHVLATTAIDAVVLYRTLDHDAASLTRILCGVKDVPIIAVGEEDRKEEILTAGATALVAFGDVVRMPTHPRQS